MALPGRGRPAQSFIVRPRISAIAPQTSTERLSIFRPAPRRPPATRIIIAGPRQTPAAPLVPAARTVNLWLSEPRRPPASRFQTVGPHLSAIAPVPWASRVRTFAVRTSRPLPRTFIARQQQTPAVTIAPNPQTVRVFAPDQPIGPRARPFLAGTGFSAVAPKPAARLLITVLVEGRPGHARSFLVHPPQAPAAALTPNPRAVRTFASAPRLPVLPGTRLYRPGQPIPPSNQRVTLIRSRGGMPRSRSFICRGRQQTPAGFVRRVWLFHRPPPTPAQWPRSAWSKIGPWPVLIPPEFVPASGTVTPADQASGMTATVGHDIGTVLLTDQAIGGVQPAGHDTGTARPTGQATGGVIPR